MEMVCGLHKKENITDSYGRPIVNKCVNIDVNSHFYDECITHPPLLSLSTRVMWIDTNVGRVSIFLETCWV
jgi:hypothetical protein